MHSSKNLDKAIFAGGCFWCMEKAFEECPGVLDVVSGYTGGQNENPTYEEVCTGQTGHVEAVEVTYDPSKVAYEDLLEIFWRQIDPTDPGGQFADRGTQYSTAIFYHDDHQKEVAHKSKQQLNDSKRFEKPIVTPIIVASPFFKAEEYHQKYYKKDPVHYGSYRMLSGRGPYLDKIWGNISDDFSG